MLIKSPLKTSPGFTIIEIVTTICIMGILAVSVLPRVLEINVFTAAIFNKKILNTLLYAQTLAMYSGCHISVNINNDAVSLALRNNCQTGDFTATVEDPNNTKNNYVTIAPKHVTLDHINFPIYFDHNGQAKAVTNNQIINASIILTSNNLQQTINLYGFNGLIQSI